MEKKDSKKKLSKKKSTQKKSAVNKKKAPKSSNNNKKVPRGKEVKSTTSDTAKAPASDTQKKSDKKETSPSNTLKLKQSEIDSLTIFNEFNTKLNFANRIKARPCLALDIDNDKICYIKIKKSGENIQVEKCGIQTLDTGMDRFRAIQLTLTNLKSRIYKHGMRVYVSFFSPDINIRQVIVPKTKKKSDLESAIFFKNQNDLPNFNSESIWNYQILEEFSADGVKKLKVLVTAIPYEVVRMYMEILISIGLTPEKLVPRPLAVTTAYNSMIHEPDNDLVVVISTFFTQIYYFRNGKLQFFRNAALGVSNIQKAMEEKSNGSLSANEEPSKLSERKESLLETDISSAIKERLLKKVKESKSEENAVIKTLYSEIKRSIDYINLNYPTEKIKRTFVTGSGIQVKEIMAYLQKQSNDSIVLLKPQFSTTEINTNRYGEYFTALGTSLQVGKEFDTIPSQYKTSQVFKNVNMLLTAFLFLSIAGAVFVSYFQKYDFIKNQNILAQLGRQYQVLNPIQTKYNDMVVKYNEVNLQKTKLQGFVKKNPQLMEVLRLFSNETPPFIILNEMNFEAYAPPRSGQKSRGDVKSYKYQITLIGQIKSDFQMGDVVLINFMNRLNDLKYFEEIKLTNKRKEPDKDLFEFWLQFYL